MKKMDYSSHKILFLGRMCRNKGVGELLTVMPRLKEQFPNVHLYLGGIWTDNKLEKKSAEMTDLVTCLGWIDKETQVKYAELCSIFVLPTYFEGQPNSVIEAMAFGMVPVASAVGGIPQMIHDHITGRLVAPQDAEALYEALAELLSSKELRRRYGEAARKHMENHYDINDLVDKLCRTYEHVMGGNP
jgi:glycosyltransferase involved in cell wall biosynthesis